MYTFFLLISNSLYEWHTVQKRGNYILKGESGESGAFIFYIEEIECEREREREREREKTKTNIRRY